MVATREIQKKIHKQGLDDQTINLRDLWAKFHKLAFTAA